MNRLWRFLPFVIMLVIADACKHSIPIPNSSNDPSVTETCDPDTVYFENDILPLLSSRCAFSGCHDAVSAKDGIILDSYTNIMNTGDVRPFRPGNSDLYEVLIETGDDRMPPLPYDGLTTNEISLVRKWIEQGALNNSCNECDTTTVTYSITITNLVQKNCISCHNAQTSNGGVRLDNYTTVKQQADNGQLIGVVNHDNGYKVMPPSGVKISACNIEQIKKWIDEGAQNN